MSFIRLENDDITITAESIISPAWGQNKPTLTTFHTSSVQSGSESGPYFLDIYSENQGTLAPSGSVEFSIAHAVSGSSFTDPKNAVWNQYATLLYGSDREAALTNLTTNFFIINVNRSKYKESLEVSGFDLQLADNTVTFNFIPADSTNFTVVDGGRKYVLEDIGSTETPTAGFMFPDVGIITLKQSSFPEGPTSLAPGFASFFGYFTNSVGNNNKSFTLFSEETITSNFIFARTRNSQLNYSTNPSFVDNAGNIREAKLVDSPQVFPTTVGLYNDANELVAVAKLSRPLIKDFNKEALLRIKLDF